MKLFIAYMSYKVVNLNIDIFNVLILFFFLFVTDYLDRVQLAGDKLMLIHIPEEYNFTDASQWNNTK